MKTIIQHRPTWFDVVYTSIRAGPFQTDTSYLSLFRDIWTGENMEGGGTGGNG